MTERETSLCFLGRLIVEAHDPPFPPIVCIKLMPGFTLSPHERDSLQWPQELQFVGVLCDVVLFLSCLLRHQWVDVRSTTTRRVYETLIHKSCLKFPLGDLHKWLKLVMHSWSKLQEGYLYCENDYDMLKLCNSKQTVFQAAG